MREKEGNEVELLRIYQKNIKFAILIICGYVHIDYSTYP